MSKNKFLAIYNVLHVNKWQLNASLFLVSSLTSFSHNSHPITYCVGSTVKVYPNLSTSAEFYYSHPNPPSFLSWIFFFFFLTAPCSRRKIKPPLPAVEVPSPNYWTAREVPFSWIFAAVTTVLRK